MWPERASSITPQNNKCTLQLEGFKALFASDNGKKSVKRRLKEIKRELEPQLDYYFYLLYDLLCFFSAYPQTQLRLGVPGMKIFIPECLEGIKSFL